MRFAVLSSIAFLSLCAASAPATTRYVDAAHCPSGDGSSWDKAFCTIEEAVSASSPGDAVYVRAGRYPEYFTMREGVSLFGGFAGTESSPDERDIELNETIIDGSATPSYTPTIIIEGLLEATVDGFKLASGAPDGGELAFYVANCGPNCVIQNVKIFGFGYRGRYYGDVRGEPGAMLLSGAPIKIDNCSFINNSARVGGAISSYNSSGLRITNSLFRGNSARETGGALYLAQSGSEIRNCQFESCTADYGGALYAFGQSACQLSDCGFQGNFASEAASDVYLEGNYAPPYSITRIQRCKFQGAVNIFNTACVSIAELDSELLDCIFAGNSSTVDLYAGKHNVSQCTFYGNQDHCIRARSYANVTLNNSIFAETTDSAIRVEDAQVFPGNCLFYRNIADMEIGATTLYRSVNEINENVPGAFDNIAGAPAFRNPEAFDFHLLATSAAIGAANAIYATYTDFDGHPRPGDDGGIEIGAYEIGDFTAPEVASITRVGDSPTNDAVVQFAVTFSEPVEGVDLSDFALDTSSTKAIASAALISIAGNSVSYTVGVATGEGDGTLRLQLIDDGSIADPDGNSLGGALPGDGDFVTGEVYTIDRTAPVISLVGNNPVDVPRGSTYSDAGATAQDNVDGDRSASIIVTGAPDTTTPGTYEIAYSVGDSAGNSALATRTVNVLREPDYYVTPAAQFIANTAATVTFDVYNRSATAQDWHAEVIEGAAWCTISAGADGASPHGQISALCLANETQKARTAKILVTSATKSALPITVAIVQSPTPKALFACNGDGASTALTYGDALLVMLLAAVLLSPRRAAGH